jgi:hypothetical protein
LLLLTVHLDDEWNNEDEEGHAHNPGPCLVGTPQKFLAKTDSVGGRPLGLVKYERLPYTVAHPCYDPIVVLLLLDRAKTGSLLSLLELLLLPKI